MLYLMILIDLIFFLEPPRTDPGESSLQFCIYGTPRNLYLGVNFGLVAAKKFKIIMMGYDSEGVWVTSGMG